jgi:hypothetical protein
MSSQCKLQSQQLCKATPLTYDLGSIWNFDETWKTMSTTISQSFNSFNSKKWKILLLLWSHLKLGPEHKMTYNSLSATPNFTTFWETHHIYVFYIWSKFQLYWWRPQRVITFKRNWLQNWGWNSGIYFNTYPNDLKFFSHMNSFMIYKIPRLQIQKSLNKGDMTKKPDLTHNLQKFITLTKQILFFWNFENRSVL